MINKKIRIICLYSFLLIVFIVSVSALPQDNDVDLTFNYPINYSNIVINETSNQSEYWNTNLGSLDGVNSTQFSNEGGILTAVKSWWDNFYCQLTGCTMSGDIDMGGNDITNIGLLGVNENITANMGIFDDKIIVPIIERDGATSILDIQPNATGYDVGAPAYQTGIGASFFKNANTYIDHNNPGNSNPQIAFYGATSYGQKYGTIGIDDFNRMRFGGTVGTTWFDTRFGVDTQFDLGSNGAFRLLKNTAQGSNQQFPTIGVYDSANSVPHFLLTSINNQTANFNMDLTATVPQFWIHDGTSNINNMFGMWHDGTNPTFYSKVGSFLFKNDTIIESDLNIEGDLNMTGNLIITGNIEPHSDYSSSYSLGSSSTEWEYIYSNYFVGNSISTDYIYDESSSYQFLDWDGSNNRININYDVNMPYNDLDLNDLFYDTLTAKSPMFMCSDDWCSVTFPKYQKTLWIQKDENYTILDIIYEGEHYTTQTFWQLVQSTQYEEIALKLNNKITKLQDKAICQNSGYTWDGSCFEIVKTITDYNGAVESYEKNLTEEYECTKLDSTLQTYLTKCTRESLITKTAYRFKNNCNWKGDYYCEVRELR